MKKLFTLASAVLLFMAFTVNAQPFTVTFNVDMSVKKAES